MLQSAFLSAHGLHMGNQRLIKTTSFAEQTQARTRRLNKLTVNGFVRRKNTLATIHYFAKCWKEMEVIFLSSWTVLLKIASVYG